MREAIKISTSEKFAIKTIWKSSYEDTHYLKDEIEILIEINHDNIIQCYEVWEDSTCVHFVLELILGGDLFDYIINSDGHKLNDKLALHLFMQIIDSLQYLHLNDIIHRDIKPENFLLFEVENNVKIKLIDFGFATRTQPGKDLSDRVGSINYIAPEILYEDRTYDNKIDIWAAGICLYNMLAGKQPFASNDVEELAEKIKNDEVKFNHPAFQYVNHELIKLLKFILSKDPEDRPTASDIKVNAWISNYIGSDENPTVVVDFKPKSSTIKSIQTLLKKNSNFKEELWSVCMEYLSVKIAEKAKVNSNLQ